jgi:hypothetical protein
MLTQPKSKQIIYGYNDTYRHGHLNTSLVEILQSCLLCARTKDDLDTNKKLLKGWKYQIVQLLDRHKCKPTKYLDSYTDTAEQYNSDFLDKLTQGWRKSYPKEKMMKAAQENMIMNIIPFFRRREIGYKMIFKNTVRGRNIVKLRGIEYLNQNNRLNYFEKIYRILRRQNISQIILVEPDIGIANYNYSKPPRNSEKFIHHQEILDILSCCSTGSLVVVKERFSESIKAVEETNEYKLAVKNSVAVFDKKLRYGVRIFYKEKMNRGTLLKLKYTTSPKFPLEVQ